VGFFEKAGRSVEKFKRSAMDAAEDEQSADCPECGEPMPADASECPHCGAELDAAADEN
jgi:tRNA(Ile2) C34 agmatinyltransferase TiaS